MSELAGSLKLAPATAQLPLSWYFDPRLLELERKYLFGAGPGYVGHELMVPNVGDYMTLEWAGHSKMLVHNANGVQLLDNICRHRQALFMEGRGNARNLVCPFHGWTYDLEGKLIGAPHFAEDPCRHLFKKPLARWNGMLFAGKRDVAKDLSGFSVAREFDLSGFVFERAIVTECKQNWKTFIEFYLDLYHVAPFHPGLGHFVTCDELRWQISDRYSAQVVGINDHLKRPGTPIYGKWHEAVRRWYGDRDPEHGAIWALYYPNIMLEWYPSAISISTLIPKSPERTLNIVEFYYPEEIALFECEFVEAHQAAYAETAAEDEVIGRRIDRGRRALFEAGIDDAGPIHSPLEDGILYFHEYLRQHLEPHL